MLSDEQLQANRENALLGGVKTDEGKSVSRFNAMRHGILTKFLTEEETTHALEIQNMLIDEFQPQSTIEYILIERIAMSYIRLERVGKAEKEQWMKINNPHQVKIIPAIDLTPIYGETQEIINEGYTPKVNNEHMELLERTYLRYETSIERNLYKALHELQRIQASRNGQPVQLPIAVDVSVDQDKNQITNGNGFVS